jgi:hypothetical protein
MPPHRRPRRRTRRNPSAIQSNSALGAVTRALNTSIGTTSSTFTRRVTLEGTFGSNGSGQIISAISFDASAYSDWGSISVIYDEFRVIGARCSLYSLLPNDASKLCVPMVMCYDNDDSSNALTSYANGLSYHVSKRFPTIWSTGRPMSITAAVNFNARNGNWYTTATPSILPHSFKYYAIGASVSTNYFAYMVDLVVQFRGSI